MSAYMKYSLECLGARQSCFVLSEYFSIVVRLAAGKHGLQASFSGFQSKVLDLILFCLDCYVMNRLWQADSSNACSSFQQVLSLLYAVHIYDTFGLTTGRYYWVERLGSIYPDMDLENCRYVGSRHWNLRVDETSRIQVSRTKPSVLSHVYKEEPDLVGQNLTFYYFILFYTLLFSFLLSELIIPFNFMYFLLCFYLRDLADNSTLVMTRLPSNNNNNYNNNNN